MSNDNRKIAIVGSSIMPLCDMLKAIDPSLSGFLEEIPPKPKVPELTVQEINRLTKKLEREYGKVEGESLTQLVNRSIKHWYDEYMKHLRRPDRYSKFYHDTNDLLSRIDSDMKPNKIRVKLKEIQKQLKAIEMDKLKYINEVFSILPFQVEFTKRPSGNYQSNVALVKAEEMKKNPKDLANEIVEQVKYDTSIMSVRVSPIGMIVIIF